MKETKAFTPVKYSHAVRRRRNLAGFTLTELLTVIFIMVILASLSIVLVTNLQKKARDGQRFSDMNTMIAALKNYKLENGSYPDSSASLTRIDQSSSSLSLALKPYQNILPADPKNDSTYYYAYQSFSAGCGLDGPFAVLVFTKAEASNNKNKEKADCSAGTFNPGDYDYSYLLK